MNGKLKYREMAKSRINAGSRKFDIAFFLSPYGIKFTIRSGGQISRFFRVKKTTRNRFEAGRTRLLHVYPQGYMRQPQQPVLAAVAN